MSNPPPHDPPCRFAQFALLAVAAFCLYFVSSVILEARKATTHFGADSWYYAELAKGNILERAMSDYYVDRVARFHPATVLIAAAWMQVLAPLTQWIDPRYLLKAMFAAAGAAGVWAALWGFAAVIPHRLALLFGTIYAVSLGAWYFASIEESKIVTASLSTLYIAAYLHLRRNWTMRGAIILTAILLVACLNEMVSGFLVVIPAVDTLMQRGWGWRRDWREDWRQVRWIGAHALAGPAALVLIEGVMFGWLVATSHPEGSTHVGMLLYYITRNYYSVDTFYAFLLNWFLFNIAAPVREAAYQVPAFANYKGYFDPFLTNYLASPLSVGVVILFVAIVAGAVRGRKEGLGTDTLPSIIPALLAYSLLRGAFFFLFNPAEPLLFSPAVTMAHILMVAIPFAAANFPARGPLLAAFAVLLLLRNGAFIAGP